MKNKQAIKEESDNIQRLREKWHKKLFEKKDGNYCNRGVKITCDVWAKMLDEYEIDYENKIKELQKEIERLKDL